jgi:hypothetical protein
MAFEKDQNEFPLPANGTNEVSAVNFLPKYFRTDTNKKFINATIDQMIKPGVVEKLNGFAGRRFSKATTALDSFIPDVTASRENYQFEPALVYKDELDNVEFYKDYNDYLGQLNVFKGNTSHHGFLNSQEFYAWNPNIDWDKFSNFREYYWLPMGPDPVAVPGQAKNVVSTYTVTTVFDDDNYAFVFTPNGFTRNPTVKLYKGQKYRFEINTPDNPFAIAINRLFLDTDPFLDYTAENLSTLYTKGITKFEYNAEGKLVPSTKDYIEEGVIEFEVPDDVPDTLYYLSNASVDTSGVFLNYEITEASSINVEEEIVGKKTYKTANDVQLSNGMKIYFQGTVTPEKYSKGYWYVEGVGDAIKLVAEQDLEVPAIFTNNFEIPFDLYGFDKFPFEDGTSFPGTKDYIVINRSSKDRNPWARYNRWFHRSVIEASALANGLPIDIDQNSRAKRPIIEFSADIKLYNHGWKAKENIDLVDTFTTDVFSTIEGSLGYNVDGVDLVDGMRVLFTADPDLLVNGKIYTVNFIIHNGRRQISLIETADTNPVEGETVLILGGLSNRGNMFYYNGTRWIQAQDKTAINQFPYFDMFDADGYSFTDPLIYPASSFTGNSIFNYRVGSGTADTELGFPLTYRSIANVGDIVFDFNLLNQSFTYQDDTLSEITKNTDTGFLRIYNSLSDSFAFENGWKKAEEKSTQAVIRNIVVADQKNNFAIDVYANSGTLEDLIVKVWVNNKRQYESVNYSISKINGIAYIDFNSSLKTDDILLIKTFSSARKNSNGFYEIPTNLEKNPLNENIVEVTLGEISDHIESITDDHPEFSGVFPGIGNMRDLSNLTAYGKRFVQHSGPLNLATYHITDKNANLIKSLRFAKNEYARFKRQFIYEAGQTGFHGSAKDHVDLIIGNISKNKTPNRPFYFSDMIGHGACIKTDHDIEYTGPAYLAMSKSFDLTSLSVNAVGVYRNGIQLLHNRDYSFNDNFVYVSLNLQVGDIITVCEYENTNGSFIPPTPTKLGLYPLFEPMLITDNTYVETTQVIQGHDGSLIKAFGDYRDELILELEFRIYNNIKCSYDENKINIYDFVPGVNRTTGFSKTSIDNIILSDFAQWLSFAGSPDYSSNTFWNELNSFTFNYSFMGDNSGQPLNGFWRNVYKTYFDTDRPHTHPWEMLGYSIKPTWWENVYGPAPYTRDNSILWQDLSEGRIKIPGQPVVVKKQFVRPNLMNHIPVNEYGQLLSPLDCGLAQEFTILPTKSNFMFGDCSPVETAWRRSSEYPFALITAWCLLQPAHIIGLGFDCSRTKRDITGNIIYTETQKRIRLEDLVFPTITINQPLALTSGLVNYVANYMVNNVTTNYDNYKTQLSNCKNQLGLKIAGFADKEKLKLVLDSRSPLNKSSVFVPEENYQIFLNTSSTLLQPVFSGIIVEKTLTGYILSGYDKENPVFYYNKPIARNADPAITVGGVSEEFVEWNENQQYVAGTVVFFNGRYYRSLSTHVSGNSFDASKFAALPSLPIVGGVTALIRNSFETDISALPYGTSLGSLQDVVDFMFGYEHYLNELGFEFAFYNTDTEALEDMKLCIKEFMFWVTQNWDIGTVISLSPAANQLKFDKKYYVVDDIFDGFYDVNVLSGSGGRITPEFSNVFRETSNQFGMKPVSTQDGIYLAKLPLVQTEHVILIDNTTVFNDTIYDVAPGYRQERIKVVGYRTDNWTGALTIPGFFYDDAKVRPWATWTDYALGDLVKYKEFFYVANTKHSSSDVFDSDYWNRLNEKPKAALYPNWDYKVNQFTDFYDLDTDNFDTEQQRLGQHLIGYQKREYLANIITDSVSQYKFYQGFIQDKGTKNALTKLFDALSSADKDSLEFYEEWAVRLGQYGAIENIYEVEFELDETKYRIEPQLFELTDTVNSTRTDLVYEIPSHKVYQKYESYDNNIFASNNNLDVIGYDSGYVRDIDVDFISVTDDQLLNLSLNSMQIGQFVWVINDKNQWDVLRLVGVNNNIVNIIPSLPAEEERFFDIEPGEFTNGFTVVFENYVDFNENDIVGLQTNVPEVNGYFRIKAVELDKIYILTEAPLELDDEYEDSSSSVSKFVTRRFADADNLNQTIQDITTYFDDKVWIDNKGDGNFGVYSNEKVFSLQEETLNPSGDADGFSKSFAVNRSNSVIVIGAPDSVELGREEQVKIYKRNIESFAKELKQTVFADGTIDANNKFGYSVAISQDAKFIAIGAPLASNAKTRFIGKLLPGSSYATGDIVSDRGILWVAKTNITGDNSTITDLSQDWSPLGILTTDSAGTVSGLSNQGVVYIYKLDTETNNYILQHCVVSPYAKTNEQFGYKVELRNTTYGTTKLFVGAPGEDGVDKGKIYFFETDVDDLWSYSRDRLYKGQWDSNLAYNADEIVFVDGVLYQSLTNGNTSLPTESILWDEVQDKEYAGYIPQDYYLSEDAIDSTVYNLATNIGKKFDVNLTGDVLVMSASADYGTLNQDDPDIDVRTERVSIYENTGHWKFLQYIDTDDSIEDFGYVVKIDDAGDVIAVAAPKNDDRGIDQGVVYLYKRTTTNNVSQFVLHQTLQSPFAEANEAFGNGIDFSSNKLAISGKNTDRRIYTTFDRYEDLEFVMVAKDSQGNPIFSRYVLNEQSLEKDNKTTFDGNNTRFVTVTKDTGRIGIFQKIGDYYIYGEDIAYDRNTKYNDISNFVLNNNHLYIGLPKLNPSEAPDSTLQSVYLDTEDSTVGMFIDMRTNLNANSWNLLTEQSGKIDIEKISRVFLYSKETNDILVNLDIIDPRQGKIAGPAEQELDFKTFYDPAIYSNNENNTSGVVVDVASNWTDRYVGKLWWDISTASWYNSYQDDVQYRAGNWNRLTDFGEIKVYEWVKTTLVPSRWAQLADTNEGFARGISGTPLYDDNVFSTSIEIDNISGSTTTYYYYWVRNKRIVPSNSNRTLSSYDVERLIDNPTGSGYRYLAPLDNNKFALYNVKSLISSVDTVLHIDFKNDKNLETNIHTEYQLLTEGLAVSKPNAEIEQKWVDSLVGYDLAFNKVPDSSLSPKQKYGILNNPRQSMFINRLEAVKQFVERTNRVLLQNQIVDNYVLDKLFLQDAAPNSVSGLYDVVVDGIDDLRFVGVAKVEQAVLTPVIHNGQIVSVTINNAGRGYRIAPKIVISGSSGQGAELQANLNSLGQIISVTINKPGKKYSTDTILTVRKFCALVSADSEIGGRWAIYEWTPLQQKWTRIDNQAFNTNNYWTYADWYADGYSASTTINWLIDQSYELFALNDNIGDIVKIKTIGSGGWLLLKKVDDQLVEDYTVNYQTIGRGNGTIQLSNNLYAFAATSSGYDAVIYDTGFYDKEPVQELRNIVAALRDDIFIGDLEQEYNKLFFAGIRYAFSEQSNIDWAFKTSFVRAKHNLGTLRQKTNYQNDNLENYEDYVKEVKPFSTKVREYISSYNVTEPTGTLTTDFDTPPSYNVDTKEIETNSAKYSANQVTDILTKYLEYPFRSWVDNNGYDVVEILVTDSGSGYRETPRVIVHGNGTTAQAYVSRGSVKSIELTNAGGKYYSAPIIEIEGVQDEGSRPAKAVAILGNGLVRKAHLTIKFDRISGNYYITDLNVTETFTGTGGREDFDLKWPVNIKTDSFSVFVNNRVVLKSNYNVTNIKDTTKTYTRFKGRLSFVEAPALASTITINYKKDVTMLDAADRINFFYNPTTGQAGKELSQLMDGVDYTGARYNSIDFGNTQGFDPEARFDQGFGSTPWDTFDNTFEDEVFVLDGSTSTFNLSSPLEAGVEYNFYLNNVRLDDPNYDSSGAITNPNAAMQTIVGDGVTSTVTIDSSMIPTAADDIVIIRKSTSDGSFTPTSESYDTALSGGNLAYSTATGLESADITVDGDGFVTATTSRGPEELVPGQLIDTLDIRVYHRPNDGIGIIGVASYKLDGNTTEFALPDIPQTGDSIIVKLDGQILDSSQYSVDWKERTLTFEDSTSSGSSLTITTVGTNGVDMLDTETVYFDGSTRTISTIANFSNQITAVVTVNGTLLQENVDYELVENNSGRTNINIVTDNIFVEDLIQYTMYDSEIQSYSRIQIDNTFESNGENDYHVFNVDEGPIPFNARPFSHNILVKSNNTILSPGYSISYTATTERDYDIESWQFDSTSYVPAAEVLVYADGVRLTKEQVTYDPVNSRIRILRNDIATIGSKIDIFVISGADYYFVDTEIEFDALDSSVVDLSFINVGDTVTLTSTNDSTSYQARVKAVNATSIVVEKYRPEIRDAFVASAEFLVDINNNDSTLLNITDVSYVESDSLTFAVPPTSGEQIEIYTFSNHDINNFSRMTYDVLSRTTVTEGTDDYVKRNLLTRGIVQLRETVYGTPYAWVAVNGELLTPYVDYTVVDSLDAVQLKVVPNENDRIDVLQFGAAPTTRKFGYRIFKDMLNRTHYKRLNEANSYKLAAPLYYYDARILLDDTTGIFQPNRSKNIPGVIFLDGERIEYFEVRGNALFQLRRGTLGTGVKDVYQEGSVAYGQGPEETISYQDRVLRQTLVSDGTSTEYTLDYIPGSINEIDVFLGGRRLRKTSLEVFQPELALDSNEGNITIPADYRIDGINLYIEPKDMTSGDIIDPALWADQKIEIIRKIGQTWNDPNKSLTETNNAITDFLRKATIRLPK